MRFNYKLIFTLLPITFLYGCKDPLPECGSPVVIEKLKETALELKRKEIFVAINTQRSLLQRNVMGEFGELAMFAGFGSQFVDAYATMPDPKKINLDVAELNYVKLESHNKEIHTKSCKANITFAFEIPKVEPKTQGVEVLLFGNIFERYNVNIKKENILTYQLSLDQLDKSKFIIETNIN